MALTKQEKIIHTNWGYWDGVAAARRGNYPKWTKGHIYRGAHPCDKHYGLGFWIGWYNEPAPPYALTGRT
jgi:hypothetical protein